MPQFIVARGKRFGYSADTKFEKVQDEMTIKMMKADHGLDKFLSGQMSAEDFALNYQQLGEDCHKVRRMQIVLVVIKI